MHSKESSIDEGTYLSDKNRLWNSKNNIIRFYQQQLEKFKKIGIDRETENGVTITKTLIKATRERLYQLSPMLKGRGLSKNG